jgi:hypothetical protein
MKRIVLFALALHCATLAETAAGDKNLPSAGGGPFRKLQAAELEHGSVPYVLDDSTAVYRQPAVLPISGMELALYLVTHDKASGQRGVCCELTRVLELSG